MFLVIIFVANNSLNHESITTNSWTKIKQNIEQTTPLNNFFCYFLYSLLTIIHKFPLLQKSYILYALYNKTLIKMLSQSQANFFIMRPIFIDHPQMKEVFKNNSYEILQFLTSDDIQNLKLTNHFFFHLQVLIQWYLL